MRLTAPTPPAHDRCRSGDRAVDLPALAPADKVADVAGAAQVSSGETLSGPARGSRPCRRPGSPSAMLVEGIRAFAITTRAVGHACGVGVDIALTCRLGIDSAASPRIGREGKADDDDQHHHQEDQCAVHGGPPSRGGSPGVAPHRCHRARAGRYQSAGGSPGALRRWRTTGSAAARRTSSGRATPTARTGIDASQRRFPERRHARDAKGSSPKGPSVLRCPTTQVRRPPCRPMCADRTASRSRLSVC